MPNLLLIAYHFPPEPAAGALRPGYLAKYLPEFGWDVTVLTRHLPDRNGMPYRTVEARVIGEEFERSVRQTLDSASGASERAAQRPSRLRRSLRWAKSTLYFPDRAAGWMPAAISQGLRITRNERFDAVLSTAMPATVHVVGAVVSARRGLPWIADYRDPWSGNEYAGWGPARARAQRWLERTVIRRATAITTISKPIAERLSNLHGRQAIDIPNAADPADWDELGPSGAERFRFCYTGSMYDGYRTPKLLFEAVASLRKECDPASNVSIDFFGANGDHVADIARQYGVGDIVHQHGTVSRREALLAQRQASDLLIFLNMSDRTADELGSKVFEYSGARRPILAFGPVGSVMREYLAERGLGWFASNLEEAKQSLKSAFERWRLGDREVRLEPGSVFEARDLASAFAAELTRVGAQA